MKTPHKPTLPGIPGIGMHEKAPCHKPGERFLRGPIPMNRLYAASRAAGRGFQNRPRPPYSIVRDGGSRDLRRNGRREERRS